MPFLDSLRGLLSSPQMKDALYLTLATGGDTAQAQSLLSNRENKKWLEQLRTLQMQQAQMEMDAAKEKQGKDAYTKFAVQSIAGLDPKYQAIYQNDPGFQSSMRGLLATQGDPAMAEQAGLLAPQRDPQAMPKEAMLYALSQQDPGFAQFLQRQEGAANQPPANVQEWQFFSALPPEQQKQFLEMKRGGYDPMAVFAAAAAKAQGGVSGKAAGEAELSAPKNAMTMQEIVSIVSPGGLIDKSTGSGLGAAADSAAGLFGVATDGATAIAELKPISHRLLMNVPRFEGPQSDKDTQSYREAAGQIADPTIPAEIRKAAALRILDLMQKAQQTQPATIIPGSSAAAPAQRLQTLREKYGL